MSVSYPSEEPVCLSDGSFGDWHSGTNFKAHLMIHQPSPTHTFPPPPAKESGNLNPPNAPPKVLGRRKLWRETFGAAPNTA